MKKHLALWLTLLAIIAVLVACTTGGGETDTTGAGTDADPTETTAPVGTDGGEGTPGVDATTSDPDDTADPDVTTGATSDGTTPEETTAPPKPDGVKLDSDKLTRFLLSANALDYSSVEVEGEGMVLKLTSKEQSNDPHVNFNFKNYAKSTQKKSYKAEDYPYVILRVKTENCSSARFELFYFAGEIQGADGRYVTQASFNNASDKWQYIVFDMRDLAGWTGEINGFRFDYQLATAGAGETMYISDVLLAKTEEEMRAIAFSDADNPFEVVTDPVVEGKVEELLATPDKAPALDNSKQDAPAEDADLDLWFNHAYTKTPAEDITSTGWYTYMLRMAKNESEGVHMLLASKNGHNGLTVEVTDFASASGATLKTELMYGYYFEGVDGKTVVDPIPWVHDGQTFDLAAGRSYMYIIKATTAIDSPAGAYTATVTVKNSEGQVIKTATVSAYVWDFALPEATTLKTQMDLSWYNIYVAHECYEGDGGLLYKNYYDLLLNNRVCAYNLPYSDEGYYKDSRIVDYLNNPRVTAFNPIDWKNHNPSDNNITAAYNFLSQKPEWLAKSYFYLVDEPGNLDQLNQINAFGEQLKRLFPGYKMMAPEHINYAWNTENTLDNFNYVKDAINVWCYKPYFHTTYEQFRYDQSLTYWMTPLLEKNLGTFSERIYAEQAEGDELWWYVTRRPEQPEITLLMDTESIRHRILFWQHKLYNVDGFLYYLVNDWYEIGENNGLNKKYEHNDGMDAYDCYGNGVLLYCGQDFDVYGAVESIRLENVRDGIEDYEYLTMLEELYGKDVADAVIHRLTTDLSHYNTDIENFTDLRVAVGNIIEETLQKMEK